MTSRQFFHKVQHRFKKLYLDYKLSVLRRHAHNTPRYHPGEISINGLSLMYRDLLSLYMEYKDIFVHRIYSFDSETDTPYIIDGGGYIGMSTLFFKLNYPKAKIICFEPDPALFKLLKANLTRNGASDVSLIQGGLAKKKEMVRFLPGAADGGKIISADKGGLSIPTYCLSEYLSPSVDFVKLNIEGQEFPVLSEAEQTGTLRNIQKLVLEYHGWAHEEQRLGAILQLLNRNGFRYMVHDFDAETNGASKPPFRITPQTTWYCLVYAERIFKD